MANTMVTNTIFNKMVETQFQANCNFLKVAHEIKDPQLNVTGVKSGQTFNIRRQIIRDGARRTLVPSAKDIQERTIQVSVVDPFGDDIEVGAIEQLFNLTLSNTDLFSQANRDNYNTYISPMIKNITSAIDKAAIAIAYPAIAEVVGDPTAVLIDDILVDAIALLCEEGVPDNDERYNALVSPTGYAALTKAIKQLHNPMATVSEAYLKGILPEVIRGVPIWKSSNVPLHTSGVLSGTPLVKGANQTGSTLLIDGAANSVVGWAKKGDIFYIGTEQSNGNYGVHPITKSAGKLRKYVVTADANSDGSGNVTLSIYPPMNADTTSPYRNIVAAPVDNAPLSFITGTANRISRQHLMVHEDFFGYKSFELPEAAGWKQATGRTDNGLIYKLTGYSDVTTGYKNMVRMDVILAMGIVTPEFACRLQSTV